MSELPPEQPPTPPVPPAPVPQQWAWVQPPQPMVPVQTEPLEYHRLYLGAPKFAWWKPLLVVLIAGSIYFAMNIAFSLLLLPFLMIFDPEYVDTAILDTLSPIVDTQHPLSLVLSLGTIVLMIPAVILAMLIMGMRPVGRLWSVAGRIRWGLLGRSLATALLAVVVMNAVGIGIGILTTGPDAAIGEAAMDRSDFSVNAAIWSIVLVIILVPFQATAEETVFRGLFLQVFGSWMRSPWLAIGLSTIVFAAMHIYDIWGLLAVGCMGLVAAWLTWKTGGLEAAIGIHIVNNLIAFGFMASGIDSETGQVESSGGPESLVGEIIGLALYAWLVTRTMRKRGYGRERIDTVLRPAPVEVAQ